MIIWSFGKCAHDGCPEIWWIWKKRMEWVCPCNIFYGMQMKEKICLTGLLLRTNHGCITTNPIQSVLQCDGNIPVNLQLKSWEGYAISWKGYAYRVLWFSGSTVSPFSEVWWKCEFCIVRVVWNSAEVGCYSQKTSRPTGKRGTASLWQCQTPYSPSSPGENSRTIVGTS
jgi:hypothetical protein